jgi:hypothetical protein
MFQPMLARWLAISTSLAAVAVSAQTAPVPRTPPPAPGEYRSALDGYQAYSEAGMVPWRAANDTVGQIGGWRAYAREATAGQGPQGHAGHAGHAAPAASAAKPAASQTKP